MRRTRPALLILLAGASGIAAFLLQFGLGILGVPKVVPQLTISFTLVFIALVVVALAWPIRRATRSRTRRRVDPFYATRVVLLAQASAVAGALLAGAAAGALAELLLRAVAVLGAFWASGGLLFASLLLLGAGLVAEAWCRVPPGEDRDAPPGAEPAS